MKSKVFLISLIAMLFSLTSSAQCINGTKSIPIYEMGLEMVEQFDKDSLEIVRIEYDLIFSKKESYRKLSSDWTYVIGAFADLGVKDLNIKVYVYNDDTEEWDFVTEDVKPDSYAMVTITPTAYALYKVEITVKEFFESYTAAKYGIFYVHE